MTSVYEEGVYVGEKVPKNKILLISNKISSIEIRKSWSVGCILEVYMDNGMRYIRKGNCGELQQVVDYLGKEVQSKYPGLCTFQ